MKNEKQEIATAIANGIDVWFGSPRAAVTCPNMIEAEDVLIPVQDLGINLPLGTEDLPPTTLSTPPERRRSPTTPPNSKIEALQRPIC